MVSDSGCRDIQLDSILIVPPSPDFNTVFPKTNQSVNGNVLFQWNRKDTVSFYRIQIAKDSIFTNLLLDTSNILKNTFSLELNTISNYHWRVFAYYNAAIIDTTNQDQFSSFNPLEIDSLRLWLKGDSVLLGTNNQVVSWFDLSDSGRVLTQNNPLNQPKQILNQLNGYSVIDFDDSTRNDFFLNAVDINNTQYYISSVYNFHEPIGRFCSFINSSLSGNRWVLGPYFKHRLFHKNSSGNNFVGTGADIIQDRFVLNTAYAIGDSVSNIINGNSVGTKESGDLPRNLRISVDNSERMNGSVAEIMIVEGGLSLDQVKKADKYLMDKYAPPINLGKDRKVCSFPDSIKTEVDYLVSYLWNTGDTTNTIAVDSAGLYYLDALDIFGRVFRDSIFIILDTIDYKFEFTQDTINSCLGNKVELLTFTDHHNYQWNTGDSLPNLTVDSTAKYIISTENCLGNTYVDSIEVIFNNPSFDLGLDTTICPTTGVELKPDQLYNNANYLWSSGEDTTAIITYTPGLYKLEVTDKYGCLFNDSIAVVVDSSLLEINLGADTILCKGNSISLLNPISTISSYLWSTGNINSFQVIDTTGNYTLKIGNGLCYKSDTINIQVKGITPIVDFLSTDLCFEDSVNFTDISQPPSGDTLVSWSWRFNQGNSTSNSTNPKFEYNAVGVYQVELKVSTNKGCNDSIQKSIEIFPNPNAQFDIFNKCSKSPIDFINKSSISSGTIAGYRWDFGDTSHANNNSVLIDPSHTYDTLGDYTISLISESAQGCLDTISITKRVNPSPNVAFEYDGTCLGDSTNFIDKTILASGKKKDYIWGISWLPIPSGNRTSLDSNFKVLIPIAKEVTAVLRVISDSLCQADFRDTFNIDPNPIADFSFTENCLNTPFDIQNQSSIVNDSIISYQYLFDQIDTSYEENPSFIKNSVGVFDMQLAVESTKGCHDTINKNINVHELPVSDFRILNNNTGIPFDLDIQNRSSNASSFIWDFGNGDSSILEVPTYTYIDTGSYNIKLKAISSFGCLDSSSNQVNSLPYFLDASLGKIILIEDNRGFLNVAVQLLNTGNNTIDQVQLVADLNSSFQFQESSTEQIYSGGITVYQFNSSFIQNEGDKVDFVCVRIASVNGISDSDLTNNYLCQEGFNDNLYVNVYPNPTIDNLYVDYVLPTEGNFRFNIYDQFGNSVITEVNTTALSGIYKIQFNLTRLSPGIYHYSFVFEGTTRSGTFLKL